MHHCAKVSESVKRKEMDASLRTSWPVESLFMCQDILCSGRCVVDGVCCGQTKKKQNKMYATKKCIEK